MLLSSRRMPASFPLSLLLGLAGIAFFIQLGISPLEDEFEPRYARGAVEMQARGDRVTPYFNGHVQPGEYPLPYWLTMLAQAIWGVNESSVRSWAALAGLGTVGLTYLLAKRLFDMRIAFASGLILATCWGFTNQARTANPAAIVTFLSTLAMYLFVRFLGDWDVNRWSTLRFMPFGAETRPSLDTLSKLDHQRPTPDSDAPEPSNFYPRLAAWQALVLHGLLSLMVLAIGPTGYALAILAWTVFLTTIVWSQKIGDSPSSCHEPDRFKGEENQEFEKVPRRCEEVVNKAINARARQARGAAVATAVGMLRPGWALIALLLITGPWYLSVSGRTEGLWWSDSSSHLADWETRVSESLSSPVVISVLGNRLFHLMSGFFPWSIVLCAMVNQVWHAPRHRLFPGGGQLFCLSWMSAAASLYLVGAWSSPDRILLGGVATCYPPLAVLTALFVTRNWGVRPGLDLIIRRDRFALVLVLGLVIVLGFPLANQRLVITESPWMRIAGILVLAGWTAIALGRGFGRLGSGGMTHPGVALITLCFGLCVFRGETIPQVDPLSSAIFARSAEPVVATYGVSHPSWVYYLGRPLRSLEVGAVSATGESGFLPRRENSPSVDEFLRQGSSHFVVTSRRHLAEIGRLSSAPLEVIADMPSRRGENSLVVLSLTDPQTARKVFPSSSPTRRR